MVFMVENNILPTNEADLDYFTCSASGNFIHELTKYYSTTNDLTTGNYPLWNINLKFVEGLFTECSSQYFHSHIRVELSQSLPTYLGTVLTNISLSEEKLCVWKEWGCGVGWWCVCGRSVCVECVVVCVWKECVWGVCGGVCVEGVGVWSVCVGEREGGALYRQSRVDYNYCSFTKLIVHCIHKEGIFWKA